MKYLKYIFNKNICNIIYNYLDQSEERLLKLIDKTKYIRKYYMYSVSILDLISRAIQSGYNGVIILNDKTNCLNNANKYIRKFNLNYIHIKRGENTTSFFIKNDKNLVYVDCLNVFKYDLIPKTQDV